MMSIRSAVLAIVAAIAITTPGHAAEWPTRLVRFIVPFTAGGATDVLTRLLCQRLSTELNVPFIVENRGGAGGNVGGAAVASAPNDGYTFLMGAPGVLSYNKALYREMRFDPDRELEPVSLFARLPNVLVVNPDVPARNVAELVAYAKANPNKLNYAEIGIGSAMHMGMEQFKFMTKTEINRVSYRGTAPAITDVVAGTVDLMFTGPPSAKSMSEGGKLKLLAVASAERIALLPDVPTVAEAGVPGYTMASWFGLLAPAKTQTTIVERLSTETKTAVNSQVFKDRMKSVGLEVDGGTPAAMLETMRSDTQRWAELIKATGITIPQ